MSPSGIIAVGLVCIAGIGMFGGKACAGYEECTTYGNRTECRGSDGSYREEYEYGNRTECYGDCDE